MAIQKKITTAAVKKKTVAPKSKVVEPKKTAVAVKKPVHSAVDATKKEVVIMNSPFWNIWDAGDQYKVRLSIPGLTKKNIRVHVDGNNLTVSGEKTQESEKEKKNFLIREYRYDAWSKSIALPKKVNEKGVKISYKDGVLKLGLKKA